jgi:hypothetical protein
MVKKYKIIKESEIKIINFVTNNILIDKLNYQLKILTPDTKLNNKNFPKSIIMGKTVKDNQIIICFKDKDLIISFLDVHIIENDFKNKKTAQINYGWSDSNYRRKGLSKLLRIILIQLLVELKINYLISIPYESAYSNNILDFLEFKTSTENSNIRFLNIDEIDIEKYLEKANLILNK